MRHPAWLRLTLGWKAVPKRSDPDLYACAIKHMARREHSRAELHAKLLAQITPDNPSPGNNVNEILDELVKRGWLSDSRVVEQMLRTRRNRFGMLRIAHELRQKGIDENLINDVMPQMRDSELEAAYGVWKRKFGLAPENGNEKARQIRFLQSRGFMQGVIFKLLRGIEDGSFPVQQSEAGKAQE